MAKIEKRLDKIVAHDRLIVRLAKTDNRQTANPNDAARDAAMAALVRDIFDRR